MDKQGCGIFILFFCPWGQGAPWFLWKLLFFIASKCRCRVNLLAFINLSKIRLAGGAAEHWGGGCTGGNWINPTSPPLNKSTLRQLTQSCWDYRRKRRRITHLFNFRCHGDPRKTVKQFLQKEKRNKEIMCISLRCCSSQRSENAQQSLVPIIFIGPFSRLLLPAWNHVCAVWSGPELEDNQPKRSCGNPTLIKRAGAVVLCRAGYLPAGLQEDLTLSPPMEAPLFYTDCYLHFSEPEQAS